MRDAPSASTRSPSRWGAVRGLVAVTALATVASGSACIGGGPPVPVTELYRILPPPAPDGQAGGDVARTAILQGALAVAPYETPGVYGRRNIVYRVDEHGYGTYAYREWALPLSDMLGLLTQERLRLTALASGGVLYDPPEAGSADYVWRGTVREFEEADRGRDVFVAVALDAQVIRKRDNMVLWTGSRRAERAVPSSQSRSMNAIVATLSALATESVDELIREAAAALRSQQPPAAPTAPGTP